MASTYETAKICPKCSQPGEVRKTEPTPRSAHLAFGTELHHVYCTNKKCKWYDTCWYIQVNEDGSIPEPRDHTGRGKLYVSRPGDEQLAQDVMRAMNAQAMAELQNGSEIPNR